MLEINMLMILAAIWGAPTLSAQADFKISQSGTLSKTQNCSGKLSFDKRPGHQAVYLRHNCDSDKDGVTTFEALMRMDQHKAYLLNSAKKTYHAESFDYTFDTVLDPILGSFKGKSETKPFLNGTSLITTPTQENFWLMQVRDPAQKNLLTEAHLMQPGLAGHIYLNYSSAPPAADAFEIPKGYKQVN